MSTATDISGLGRKSEQVLRALQRKLTSGEWPAHSRLPTEGELCDQFGVSRNTLRRAVARLVEDGWLEVRQGSGTYVRRTGDQAAPAQTISVMFPFDGQSLQQVQRQALERGYLLSVFAGTHWEPGIERIFLQRVLEQRHRALLAFCTPIEPRNEQLLAQLEQAGVRVIHIEHYSDQLPSQSYVLPDYQRGGYIATTTLMIAGCTDIRFVALEPDGPYVTVTQRGVDEAMADHGWAARRDRHVNLQPAITKNAQSRRGAEALIDSLEAPAGLVARSTELAAELIEVARVRGRRVPEDVSVIGIDHLVGPSRGVADQVSFDWAGLLARAMDAACAPQWQGIREMIRPNVERVGTVRAPAG